jgi:hypothetical protein
MATKRLACGLLIGGVTMVASAFPAVAGATDYPVPPGSGPAFATALAQAQSHPGADRIFLGAGYYTAPSVSGFQYYNLNDPVEIIGAGRDGAGATIINGQLGGGFVSLRLFGAPGTSIHDLRIELPINAAGGTSALQTTAVARHITVYAKDAQQSNDRTGVTLAGGTLEDSIVDVGQSKSTGVAFDDGGPGTIRGSTVSASTALISAYGGLVDRSRLIGTAGGIQAFRNQTTIRSSQVKVQGPSSTAIWAYTTPGSDDNVVIDGVNVLGPGGPDTRGVWADNQNAVKQTVTVTNSILRGFSVPLRAESATHVAASYSDYDGSGNKDNALGLGISESNITNVGDAGFATPGDYHLAAGSPLVDAGDPATAQGLDLGGNPLVADGNNDGTARRDIGAYELGGPAPGEQPQGATGGGTQATGTQTPDAQAPDAQAPDAQAPVMSGFASTKNAFARKTRFRYTLSEAARVRITIQRVIRGRHTRYRTVGTITRTARAGANSTVFTGTIGKRRLRSGRYRAIALATDAAQNRSAPKRAAFRIAR